jgi:hypothetical protein
MPVTINGTNGVTFNDTTNTPTANGTVIISGTAVASTSGTSIDFTGIPSWVKRITISLGNLSTNGTAFKLIQIGAGSILSSGYASQSSFTSSGSSTATSTAGFIINSAAAGEFNSGQCVLTLISSNVWACSLLVTSYSAGMVTGAGYVSLGGTLDRVRITTTNGTDSFDSGSINILYE